MHHTLPYLILPNGHSINDVFSEGEGGGPPSKLIEVTSTRANVNNKSRRFWKKNVSVYCIGLASETEIIWLTDKGKQRHVLCVPRSCK